ncbi:MAG TPA: hemolysin family protein [Draconibacterium sp.]|nr:hemolysin family protein [Draconibacterium sp.]
MEPGHYFIIFLLGTLLSAYFTGTEIALVSAWKSRFDIAVKPEFFFSKLKETINSNPDKYIATILIGNFVAFTLTAIAFIGLLFPVFHVNIQSNSTILMLTIIISALVILIFGKLLPKILFRIVPDLLLSSFLIPLLFFYFLFYPITRFMLATSKKLINQKPKTDENTDLRNHFFNRIDLDWLVDEKNISGVIKKESIETEVTLFKNALDFSKVKLREIMVPRTEIEMLEMNSSMEELRQRFVETGYSRIIFYDQNIDNIVGYVHSSVIFKNPESFKPFINNVLIVPETMPANKLLSTFIREHRSIAIVVDEFGGTSGMVTSEDILEEIFGEIEDEHDTIDVIEKKISDTEFVFSGRSEIDLLNEKYNINLPESEDFETLAGFILYHHESIPKINSLIKIGAFHFKILKATNTKIELVKLTILNY